MAGGVQPTDVCESMEAKEIVAGYFWEPKGGIALPFVVVKHEDRDVMVEA